MDGFGGQMDEFGGGLDIHFQDAFSPPGFSPAYPPDDFLRGDDLDPTFQEMGLPPLTPPFVEGDPPIQPAPAAVPTQPVVQPTAPLAPWTAAGVIDTRPLKYGSRTPRLPKAFEAFDLGPTAEQLSFPFFVPDEVWSTHLNHIPMPDGESLQTAVAEMLAGDGYPHDVRYKNLMENIFITPKSVLVQLGKAEAGGNFRLLYPAIEGTIWLERGVAGRGWAAISFPGPPLPAGETAYDPTMNMIRYWIVPNNPLYAPYLLQSMRYNHAPLINPKDNSHPIALLTILGAALIASRADLRTSTIRVNVIEKALVSAQASVPPEERNEWRRGGGKKGKVAGPTIPRDATEGARFTRRETLLCRYVPLVIGTRYSTLAALGAQTLRVPHIESVEGEAAENRNYMLQFMAFPEFSFPEYVIDDGLSLPNRLINMPTWEDHYNGGTLITTVPRGNVAAHDSAIQSALTLLLHGYNIANGLPPSALDGNLVAIGARMREYAALRDRSIPFAAWRKVLRGDAYAKVAETLRFSEASFNTLLSNYAKSEGRYAIERYLKWPANVALAGTQLAIAPAPPPGDLNSTCYTLARITAIVASHAIAESLTQLHVHVYTTTIKDDKTQASAWYWYQLTRPDMAMLPLSSSIEHKISKTLGKEMLDGQQALIAPAAGKWRAVGDYIAHAQTHDWDKTRTPLDKKLSIFNGQDDVASYQDAGVATRRAKILVQILRTLWFHKASDEIPRDLGQKLQAFGTPEDDIDDLLNALSLDTAEGIEATCRTLVGIVFHSHLIGRAHTTSSKSKPTNSVLREELLDALWRFEGKPADNPSPDSRLIRVLMWLYANKNRGINFEAEEPLLPSWGDAEANALFEYEGTLTGMTDGDNNGVVHVGDPRKYPVRLIAPVEHQLARQYYDSAHGRNWTWIYNVLELANMSHSAIGKLGTKKPSDYVRFPYTGFNLDPTNRTYDLPSTIVDFVYSLRDLAKAVSKRDPTIAERRCIAATLASQHRLAELMQACYLIQSKYEAFNDTGADDLTAPHDEFVRADEWKRSPGKPSDRDPETADIDSDTWTHPRLHAGETLTSLTILWLRRFLYFGKLQSTVVMDAYLTTLLEGKDIHAADRVVLTTLAKLMDLAIIFGNARHPNLMTHSLVQNLFALSLALDDVDYEHSWGRNAGIHESALVQLWAQVCYTSENHLSLVDASVEGESTPLRELVGTASVLNYRHLQLFGEGRPGSMDEQILERRKQVTEHIKKVVEGLFNTAQSPFKARPHDPKRGELMHVHVGGDGSPTPPGRKALVDAVLEDLERGVGLPEYYLGQHLTYLHELVMGGNMPRDQVTARPTTVDSVAARLEATSWNQFAGWRELLVSKFMSPSSPQPPPMTPSGGFDFADEFFSVIDTAGAPFLTTVIEAAAYRNAYLLARFQNGPDVADAEARKVAPYLARNMPNRLLAERERIDASMVQPARGWERDLPTLPDEERFRDMPDDDMIGDPDAMDLEEDLTGLIAASVCRLCYMNAARRYRGNDAAIEHAARVETIIALGHKNTYITHYHTYIRPAQREMRAAIEQVELFRKSPLALFI